MKTRAAVLRQAPGDWSVEELEIDDPKENELLVEMVATGLWHSDDHIAHGDITATHLPFIGGHEGGGIVREVGPGVTGFEVGDHVLTSFVPACGTRRWCASGKQNLCDNGALILDGHQMDGTFRMRTADGLEVATSSLLGTFSEWQIYDQMSLLKIDKDIPLEVACLVACGVQTGFGSATTAGDIKTGDVVVIAGVGGVGMNAVQGARERGAAHVVVIDPVSDKQIWSTEFGATEAYGSFEDAAGRIAELTNGQGADVVILTAGLVTNDLVGPGLAATRKAGTLVIVGVSAETESGNVPGFNALGMAMFQKRIQGAIYGMASPREAMPMLLNLYRAGRLTLDELVTKVYTLDQINEAFTDMREGRNIRGVIKFGAGD